MADQVDIKQIVDRIKKDGVSLATDNIALVKAEIKPAAKNAGIGGGMFGAAGYLAINAATLMFIAGSLALGLIFFHAASMSVLASGALGFVTLAVLLLLLAGLLALIGRGRIKQIKKPEFAIAEAKASVESLKSSVQAGIAQVQANSLERKGLTRR